jgi:drug/metabolite transporter (DMT)-like permease
VAAARASAPPGPRAASPPARGAAVFVLLASAAFAAASPLARWARPAHPLLVAFGRLAIAAVVLSALDARHLPAAVRGLSTRQRCIVLTAGALLAAHFACFLWGLEHTSLPAAVSLVSLEPLAVVLCAWAFLGVVPSRAEQLGVVLATAGAVVVAQGVGTGDHQLVGDLAVLVAVALFGLYLAVARALKDALPARSYAALVYTSASLVLAALLAAAPAAFTAPAWPPPAHALVAVAALGIIPTVIGHTMVQTASRTLSPAVVALVCPGETLGGIAIGAAVLGAVPTRVELLGAAIILAGAAVAILAPRGGRA